MRIFSSTRRKITATAVAILAGIALVPVLHTAATWGPVRTTFTWANPATYITFNSITDNPVVGDERTFYTGAESGTSTQMDKVTVRDNEEVTLRVFFHNNAASNLNLVATNTRVKMILPTTETTSSQSTASISADNANPGTVTDTVDFAASQPFTLEYETGSAKLWTNYVSGIALSDNVVSSNGTLVGSNGPDGRVPGCSQFSGYVTIKVKVHVKPVPPPIVSFACTNLDVAEVDRTHFNLTAHAAVQNASVTSYTFTAKNSSGAVVDTKTVTTNALTAQYAFASVTPGDYAISAVVNTDHGSTNPADCTKTVTVKPVTVQPTFACTGLDVNEVSRTQFNFMAHASVSSANVTGFVFTAKDASGNVVDTKTVTSSALSAPYTFTNNTVGTYTISAVVNTDHGSTNPADCTKTVTVKPVTVQPAFACTGLDVNKVGDTQFNFTAHGTADNAVISSYAFVAKDANGATVDTKTVSTSANQANYTFNQSNPGTYTVSAVVNTDHGSTQPGDCTKTVTVAQKNIPAVCSSLTTTLGANRSATAKVNITPSGTVPKAISYDFGDGSTALLTDKTTADHTYAKDGTYTIAATATFDDSKDQQNTSRCAASVTITTPVTPVVLSTSTPLPNTGPGDVLGLFTGISAFGAAGHYMVSRRRRG